MWLFLKLRVKLGYLNREQLGLVYRAYRFARKKHTGQYRQSGEAYIHHPVEVAVILSAFKIDHFAIASALLHDTIEDTSTDKRMLESIFGETIANLVDGVSKLSKIQFQSREEAQAENLRKMFLAMSSDLRVVLIKLADRLHNMRTIASLPLDRQKRKAQETFDIFAPIASRLGMHEFATEMEDLSFAVIFPLRHLIILDRVNRIAQDQSEHLAQMNQMLEEAMGRSHLVQYELQGRIKSLYSIYRKMKKRKLPLAHILDVYAFRVLVENQEDCYRCLGVIHQLFRPLTERFKDYIASPKPNQYQSLHTTLVGPGGVPIEIQIRSYEMDRIANHGVASHWRYKAGGVEVSSDHLIKQRWIQNLLDMWKLSENSSDFIEHVKMDLFPRSIYVFTPQGDVLSLPRGATVLDFAYAVHSDIGDRCATVRVDRHLVPISTVLTNGQTVEVITSDEVKPDVAWLEFVVTGKARGKISSYVKQVQLQESRYLGEMLLDHAFGGRQVHQAFIEDKQCLQVLHRLDLKDLKALYELVGSGALDAKSVAALAFELCAASLAQFVGLWKKSDEKDLLINGKQGCFVQMSSCCSPVYGDTIVGVLYAKGGIHVHQVGCHAMAHSEGETRLLALGWDQNVAAEFKVSLKLMVLDQPGILAEITTVMASTHANISDLRLLRRGRQFCEILVDLFVWDRQHLAQVIRDLRGIVGVTQVIRYEKNRSVVAGELP